MPAELVCRWDGYCGESAVIMDDLELALAMMTEFDI